MHDDRIVINTGPLLALVATLGDLAVLKDLYRNVHVPFEVCQEIRAGGVAGFAVEQFEMATWLQVRPKRVDLPHFLANALDPGEAAVIQLALLENIQTVCIDEAVGRRMARLCGLQLTGSIGILLRAKREGVPFVMAEALQRMRNNGIWLSQNVLDFAMRESGEN